MPIEKKKRRRLLHATPAEKNAKLTLSETKRPDLLSTKGRKSDLMSRLKKGGKCTFLVNPVASEGFKAQ
ncbi:hypothetical protein A0126_05380 [Exiguobacterium sp. N4-1P]|nr:hypothetical protein A0126_05380 [Exiguobacterium sp. N4-1P]